MNATLDPFLQRTVMRAWYLCIFAVWGFCHTGSVFAQDLQLQYDRKELKACSRFSKSPVLLTEALTAGKGSDKEKFDAIFAWVALNIHYDYNIAFSNSGTPQPRIKKILKKKRGVCLDYAYLMDTLCTLANIPSYTVYGYAKDELSDVNDSIFSDNHAWNAVKLDGLWYVYDVTWSTGKTEIVPTRLGRIARRLIDRIPSRTKTITISLKPSVKTSKFCGTEINDTTKVAEFTYEYKVYRHRWLRNLLLRIPIRYTLGFQPGLDTSFYLCEPKVFAITHYPDNPVWSLLSPISIQQYSGDSAFYYLDSTTYKTQHRQGTSCGGCDAAFDFDPLKKHEDLLDKSLKLNKNNRFTPYMCENKIASIKYELSVPVEDSLPKITLLDTSLAYLRRGMISLEKARLLSGTDFALQKKKNSEKLITMRFSNKTDRSFADRLAKECVKKKKETESNGQKLKSSIRKYYNHQHFIEKLQVKTGPAKKEDEKVKQDVLLKLNVLDASIDSLRSKISLMRVMILQRMDAYSDSLWKMIDAYFAFRSPYQQKMRLRDQFYDDYKRELVNFNKVTEADKTIFEARMQTRLVEEATKNYQLMDTMLAKTEQLFALYKIKFALHQKLVKNGSEPADSLLALQSEMLTINQEDQCWVRSRSHFIKMSLAGYKLLRSLFLSHKFALKAETWKEEARFRFVNRELARRLYRSKSIVSLNKSGNSADIRLVKNYKTAYLKKRKEEANAAKRAAKK